MVAAGLNPPPNVGITCKIIDQATDAAITDGADNATPSGPAGGDEADLNVSLVGGVTLTQATWLNVMCQTSGFDSPNWASAGLELTEVSSLE